MHHLISNRLVQFLGLVAGTLILASSARLASG